jgi:hypothetical protein
MFLVLATLGSLGGLIGRLAPTHAGWLPLAQARGVRRLKWSTGPFHRLRRRGSLSNKGPFTDP